MATNHKSRQSSHRKSKYDQQWARTAAHKFIQENIRRRKYGHPQLTSKSYPGPKGTTVFMTPAAARMALKLGKQNV